MDEGSNSAQSFRRGCEALKGDRRWQQRRGLIGVGRCQLRCYESEKWVFKGEEMPRRDLLEAFQALVGPRDSGGGWGQHMYM
jgi:hypothetical protein